MALFGKGAPPVALSILRDGEKAPFETALRASSG
jgi:hypothetical protein